MKRKGLNLFILAILILSAILAYRYYGKKEVYYSTLNKEALEHYHKGVEYTLMFYIPEAEKEFKLSVKADPSFPLPYVYLILLSYGQENRGLTDYYKKLSLNQQKWTDFERQIVNLFLEYSSDGKNIKGDQKLKAKLEKLIDKYAERIEIFPILLPIYQKVVGNTDELIKYYEYLHSKFPNNTQIINRLGYMYLSKRDYKKAEAYFKKYIFVEPGNANPYDSIADLYYSAGDYKKAEEYYKKALSIKPDFFNSQIKLILCYALQGKLTLAKEQCDSFLSRVKTDIFKNLAISFKALIYAEGGEKDKLEKLYLSIEKKKDERCYLMLAKAYYFKIFKLSEKLKTLIENSKKCNRFVKSVIKPFEFDYFVFTNQKEKAYNFIKSTIKNFDSLNYDVKELYANSFIRFYLKEREFEKAERLAEKMKERDKAYFYMLIYRANGDKEKCLEFAKKVIQYYNEADDNFYKKREALKCLNQKNPQS